MRDERYTTIRSGLLAFLSCVFFWKKHNKRRLRKLKPLRVYYRIARNYKYTTYEAAVAHCMAHNLRSGCLHHVDAFQEIFPAFFHALVEIVALVQ